MAVAVNNNPQMSQRKRPTHKPPSLKGGMLGRFKGGDGNRGDQCFAPMRLERQLQFAVLDTGVECFFDQTSVALDKERTRP